ncbi:MAG: class I SAM-dependent methyltransferase [Burkholderiales bacterium]|jgi:SAM-dependent methyltransferase|nr:class I SAM-dependent methyltransferase [Burkholderiales bacterium]
MLEGHHTRPGYGGSDVTTRARRDWLAACAGLVGTAMLPARAGAQQAPVNAPRGPDVVFVPTPREVVDEMLAVAKVGPKDVLYDLGSGDGRIPITAAQRWGTRGVGVDIDPQRIEEANANAIAAKVTDRVRFVQGDLFEMDLSPATVITLYLLPDLNVKLRPTLLKLKAGTRIVSHDFAMGDWRPERRIEKGNRTVYFWTVPAQGKPYPKM